MALINDLIVSGPTHLNGSVNFNQGNCSSLTIGGNDAATTKDLQSYLPLKGGKLTGNLVLASSASIAGEQDDPISINITSDSIGINKSSNTICNINSSGRIWATGGVYISSTSKLNIGSSALGVTTSGNTTILTVDSSITAQGDIQAPAFYETSDIRKKDIKSDISIDKCYDLLDKCQTIVYTLKDSNKEQVGLIAQEVEEFFPEIVCTDNEGFKTLDYSRLTVICLKLIKDLISRIKKLEDNGRN